MCGVVTGKILVVACLLEVVACGGSTEALTTVTLTL